MKVSRRNFLWLSGAVVAGSLAAKLGCAPEEPEVTPDPDEPTPDVSIDDVFRIEYAETVSEICPICGVGCGVLSFVEDGKIVAIEGDPDHPINEGALCSKGAGIYNMYYHYDEKGEPVPNPQRVTEVMYRAPGSSEWEVKDWDWAIEEIAKRTKATRDEYFTELDTDGGVLNHCAALSWVGTAMCTNEENYLYQKFCRAMGINNLDHCARL